MKWLQDSFLHQVHAIKAGFTLTIFSSNQLINLYSKNGFLREARKMFDEMPERNVFSWNAVISSYVRSGDLKGARELFEAAKSERDLVTYNTLLSGFAGCDGYESEAIEMLVYMQRLEKDGIRIDEFSVTTMLNLCAKLSNVCYGAQLHGFMVKTGNDASGFSVSSLIDMYSKCGYFNDAYSVYDGSGVKVVDSVAKNAMVAACFREGEVEKASSIFWRNPELNDAVSWNTMISGYAQNRYEEESLRIFVYMKESDVRWNNHTIASVLKALSSLKILKLGKGLHTWVLKNGLYSNQFISSGLVDVYCKCGKIEYAELVHSLYCCGCPYSISSMIVGHSSQRNVVEAKRLFDSLSEKNPVAWTAIFSSCLKSQQPEAIFELLREYTANVKELPESFVMVSILGACLQASMEPGKQIHAYILRTGISVNKKLITALVDMYSKCGSVEYAEKIFAKTSERDEVLYNAMISGFAHHGHESEAFHLFEEMTDNGFRPDEITFMAVLSACRHRGQIAAGEKYFNSMKELYNITPEVDHYTCMIDLYGKANRLDKALEFMKGIRVEEDAAILGALLEACKLNKNAELAKEVEEKLLKIEGYDGSRYVQLANIYASAGKWEEMGRIRKQMRGKELKKFVGCSWAYIENRVHTFISSDVSHPEKEDIYSMLDFLTKDLSDAFEYI
ncbi:PREDICTED: putative pentatricopeptide repeat-containing protein At3g18840 [Tarenaya hassleriana]|uniref:putative pentatricopeptide repeat-containing protein At3g18840 n=1 Tax=Tarenaya hassleriana TaxID=28532 RepID=UPI00053C25F0|nr:PREDICTED: putative pentatricopeptide repeat-containing protein At3g18840 [Tarenaya hassleriana]